MLLKCYSGTNNAIPFDDVWVDVTCVIYLGIEMKVAQKTVILDYQEEQGFGHIQVVYWDSCVTLQEMNVYTQTGWLVV